MGTYNCLDWFLQQDAVFLSGIRNRDEHNDDNCDNSAKPSVWSPSPPYSTQICSRDKTDSCCISLRTHCTKRRSGLGWYQTIPFSIGEFPRPSNFHSDVVSAKSDMLQWRYLARRVVSCCSFLFDQKQNWQDLQIYKKTREYYTKKITMIHTDAYIFVVWKFVLRKSAAPRTGTSEQKFFGFFFW